MEYKTGPSRIWLENEAGESVAEVYYPPVSSKVVDIRHTVVNSSLGGKGIGGEMLQMVAEQLEKEGRKARLTCPYAKRWWEKHPEYSHLSTNSFLE